MATPFETKFDHLMRRVKVAVTGPPLDALAPHTRHNITLIALLAWVGLGADGLSSSAYGPEQAYLTLGEHADLAFFLAIATAVTVFIIALSYNQVIALFPTGGGGYKVATRLLGKNVGLVSGSALVIDYVLTIAISIAAGVDALFSFAPAAWLPYKIEAAVLVLSILMLLNLRGVKESIKFLLPIFVSFVVTHAFLIIYGIGRHASSLDDVFYAGVNHALSLTKDTGWFFAVALFIRAYGMGGGTYTGIEAVSNSVNLLKEPRVRTGQWTMFYMALSLSFTAGGIILLYLLWRVQPSSGQTLNAVAFSAVVADWPSGGNILVAFTMLVEAGLLFVAANTGFLGGPATLANMAADEWVPHRFGQLSERLVTKNGIVLMGIASLAVMLWSGGRVELLVVLYSINVFLTFSITLSGLCVYWWSRRHVEHNWIGGLLLAASGLLITSSIMLVMFIERFNSGGWVAVLVTATVVAVFASVKWHYKNVTRMLRRLDDALINIPLERTQAKARPIVEGEPAAVFFVSRYRGVGIHTVLNVQKLFPGRFHNFIFISVGEIDTTHMKGDDQVEKLQHDVDGLLNKYVDFCRANGLASQGISAFSTDPVEKAVELSEQVYERFPGSVFFAGTLVFTYENWLTRVLHNQTALALQRQLHLRNLPLVIIPLRVDNQPKS